MSAEFESEVLGLLLARAVLARLLEDRYRLISSVPSRSSEPARYRESVVRAAEQILRILAEGPVASEDWTAVIKSGYPEWYDEHDMPSETLSKRVWRARGDTRTLLRALVQREDAPRRGPERGFVRPLQAPLRLAGPSDERVRTADDAAIATLFLRAEQTLLPEEDPYDLDRGLQLFTAWLDNQTSGSAGEHPR